MYCRCSSLYCRCSSLVEVVAKCFRKMPNFLAGVLKEMVEYAMTYYDHHLHQRSSSYFTSPYFLSPNHVQSDLSELILVFTFPQLP